MAPGQCNILLLLLEIYNTITLPTPSGIYALTQVMDAVAFFNLPEGVTPTDAEVLLDGVDASTDFSACFLSVPGTVSEGGRHAGART